MRTNYYSLQDATKDAEEHFGIIFPTTLDKFKKAFKKRCFELRADRGENKIEFGQMKEVYDKIVTLQEVSDIFIGNNGAGKITTTIEGLLLSELGLGLGMNVNANDCSECTGNGYTEYLGRRWTVCNNCDEDGFVKSEFICRDCKGSGKFRQRRTKEVVNCKRCSGTGKFKHPHLVNLCLKCRGSKTLWSKDKESVLYRLCWKCKGAGEIKIWNPVLPKGLILLRK